MNLFSAFWCAKVPLTSFSTGPFVFRYFPLDFFSFSFLFIIFSAYWWKRELYQLNKKVEVGNSRVALHYLHISFTCLIKNMLVSCNLASFVQKKNYHHRRFPVSRRRVDPIPFGIVFFLHIKYKKQV